MIRILFANTLFFIMVYCSFCRSKEQPMKKFNKTLAEATTTFLSVEGVHAVAQGKTASGKDCIMVYVADTTTDASRLIPKKYKKIAVELVQSDSFKTF